MAAKGGIGIVLVLIAFGLAMAGGKSAKAGGGTGGGSGSGIALGGRISQVTLSQSDVEKVTGEVVRASVQWTPATTRQGVAINWHYVLEATLRTARGERFIEIQRFLDSGTGLPTAPARGEARFIMPSPDLVLRDGSALGRGKLEVRVVLWARPSDADGQPVAGDLIRLDAQTSANRIERLGTADPAGSITGVVLSQGRRAGFGRR